jgi:hypothetical protein
MIAVCKSPLGPTTIARKDIEKKAAVLFNFFFVEEEGYTLQ